MIASDSYWENGTGHPRTTGTFSRVLGRFARAPGSLKLMDALRKMTLMPAQRLEARVPAMRNKGPSQGRRRRRSCRVRCGPRPRSVHVPRAVAAPNRHRLRGGERCPRRVRRKDRRECRARPGSAGAGSSKRGRDAFYALRKKRPDPFSTPARRSGRSPSSGASPCRSRRRAPPSARRACRARRFRRLPSAESSPRGESSTAGGR